MKTHPAIHIAHRILSHPDVQRAGSGAPDSHRRGDLDARRSHWQACQTEGMRRLYRAKIARRNARNGQRNCVEEARSARNCERRYGPGSAHDAGFAVAPPPSPNYLRAIKEALELGGLTLEIERRCRQCFQAMDASGEKRE